MTSVISPEFVVERYFGEKDTEFLTLSDLVQHTDGPGRTVQVEAHNIRVNLTGEGDRGIIVDADVEYQFPAESSSMENIADWVGLPSKWVAKAPVDVQEFVLNRYLSHSEDEVLLGFDSAGLVTDAHDPGQTVIPKRQIIDVAANVLGWDSVVIGHRGGRHDGGGEFAFDIVVPFDSSSYIGGDRAVGDLTAGGLRFIHDRKRNLTPSVQPFFYRLICTNGMETFDGGLKIEGRGATPEAVLAELEMQSVRALGRVNSTIEHYYAMKQERVDNPERLLRRMAKEYKIPDRMLGKLQDAVPMYDNPTLFDMVNLVTNLANHESFVNRPGGARQLEQIGGAMVLERAARCGHCQTRIE